MALAVIAHLDRAGARRLRRPARRRDDRRRFGLPSPRATVHAAQLEESSAAARGCARPRRPSARAGSRSPSRRSASAGTSTRAMPELGGQARGMQRRAAAEGHHGAALGHLAALDGMHARGVRHVLLDDLADAGRRPVRIQAERRADPRRRPRARPPRGRAAACRRRRRPARCGRARHWRRSPWAPCRRGRSRPGRARRRRCRGRPGCASSRPGARSSRRRRRSRPSRSRGCAPAARCP